MKEARKILTGSECHLLLKACEPKRHTHKHRANCVRNRAMILVMLDAGLRVGEMVQLRLTNLLYGGVVAESIIVTANIAKTKIERIVPMSGRLKYAIEGLRDRWWVFKEDDPDHFAFFTTNPHRHVTTRQAERILRALSMEAIGRPVHPHGLRHTFATRAMRRAPQRVVMELLGHKSLASTQIYTHPDSNDLKGAIDAIEENDTGPVDKPVEIL